MTSKSLSNALLNGKAASHEAVSLPVRGNIRFAYALSLLIALIMGSVSLGGIFYQTGAYPTEEFLKAFLPTDVVNLCIGLPVLLSSMWLARRGSLIGLLFWPGALFCLVYNYLISVFALPLGWILLSHLILVMLSLYTMIALISSIDGEAVQGQLSGRVPNKVAGGMLVGFGVSFLLLATGVMIEAISRQPPVSITELALQKVDFLITPTWLIGGLLLWRRSPLGYVVGTGLLFQSSMLMISLLVVILLKPVLTADPFVVADFVWILAFSLCCIIPLMLFIRGLLSTQRSME